MIRSLCILSFFIFASLHPVHVSVSNLEFIENEECFTLAIKLFADDFQALINHNYNTDLDLINRKDPGKGLSSINDYIRHTYKININGKSIDRYTFKRYEFNEQSIWLYYTFSWDKKVKNMMIENTILFNWFMDQTNLVIVVANGKQLGYRSTRKNYKIEVEL